MKSVLKKINILLFLFIAYGCIEKEGYYDYNQQDIISNLTANKWERKYHDKLDNGTEMDIHEIYSFSENGSGSHQSVTTYINGDIENNTSYFHWSFTTPNFKYIYFDYPLFWEIQELSNDNLSIIETYRNPISVPNQHYRDFQEYHSLKP